MKKSKEKICEVCGKVFIPTGNNQKYCTKCAKIKRTESCKKWHSKNPEWNHQRYIKIVQPNNKGYKEKFCKNCNNLFKPNSSTQKYCTSCRESFLKKQKKEYQKTYYKKNKDKILKKTKKWYESNKPYLRVLNKDRRCNDSQYKLSIWCRQQIRRCLNSNKTKHTFDILGYTQEQLKQRLEMNFKQDMTWENHGTLWHIDHRKPLCKFNLTLPNGTPNYEQIRLANSLANLQPLYVTENLSKGGK